MDKWEREKYNKLAAVRARKEKRLKIENWKERNKDWYYVYKGTRRALNREPIQVNLAVTDIIFGVLVGIFPYALLFLYILER